MANLVYFNFTSILLQFYFESTQRYANLCKDVHNPIKKERKEELKKANKYKALQSYAELCEM